jgi:hypothetical protein
MAPMLTPTIKTSSIVIISWLTLQSTATAGGFLEEAVSGVVNTAVKAVNDTANTGIKAIEDTANTGKKAIDDTAKTVEKAGQDAGETGKKAVDDTLNTGKKAIDDVLRNSTKAVDDVARNAVKSANDIVDAGKAVERFVEYQVQGVGDSLSDAEKRIREGKIVDAAWHLGTDPYKHTEEGASKAAQESQLINAAGQAAASFYGGPAGAAAYASWYAYCACDGHRRSGVRRRRSGGPGRFPEIGRHGRRAVGPVLYQQDIRQPSGGEDGLLLHVNRGRQMLGDFAKTASGRSRQGSP